MSKFVTLCIVLLFVFLSQLDVVAAENRQIDVKSEAAVLLDSDTGAVLYAKNGEKRMYPASLTKIATAIYAIENGNLDDIVTVSANAVRAEGTKVYLNEGEKVPLRKLIQGMLINSGNDAAVATAEYLDGSVDQFAAHLNTYLTTKIGVKNTHFTNPNGLFNEKHYTTALDLAIITNYAIKNPVFSEIFGTKELKWNGQSWNTTLITHHLMLKGEIPYPGITGGKTGYVNESKQTLATTAFNGKLHLTVIEFKANQKIDIYNDTIHLLDYGFTNFQHKLLQRNEIFKEGRNEYFPLHDALITEPNKGALQKLNQQGLLLLENSNGEVMQRLQLNPKTVKPVLKNKPKTIENQAYHLNAIYGIVFIVAIGIVMSLRNKITRKT
ncbi:D-alanyl-D-alanine carboxypeptidase family protein [Neobacillus sp. PS3-40]|uniref:D-alanyl-D-alanine carboxypeptidase family protein n=1 Tax=Neobacillus sp. PS3-40 TaxID=3070679 RepID=UPI0027E0B031|nr:D-alanyl-D-alanine carboxypeptidase family protein [Neobacillus sp. PS3-40]WML44936.1 D-alanyl-D-alanine carboxypeptidase family protein [Neobacillus sp. PS3-40]